MKFDTFVEVMEAWRNESVNRLRWFAENIPTHPRLLRGCEHTVKAAVDLDITSLVLNAYYGKRDCATSEARMAFDLAGLLKHQMRITSEAVGQGDSASTVTYLTYKMAAIQKTMDLLETLVVETA